MVTTMNSSPVMLITGGTGSIGREIARQALAAGWAVIIQGRRQTSVDDCLAALTSTHADRPLAGVCADIRDNGAITDLVAQAAGKFQRLDAVVDCLATGPAHGTITGPFAATTPEVYSELLHDSVSYLQRLAHAALPWLVASGGCLISFISDSGLYPARNQSLIASARAASVGFIRNFALDAAREGVRAHCISLSYVLETRTSERLQQAASGRLQNAQKRAGLGLPTPQDIAPTVLFLCGAGARRITGQVISINGGLNT